MAALRIPVELLRYFQALWPEREHWREYLINGHYIIRLAPFLRAPSLDAQQWLLDQLQVQLLTLRLMGKPPYDAEREDQRFKVPLVNGPVKERLGAEEVVSLLAIADFYDVSIVLGQLGNSLGWLLYTLKFTEDFVATTPEERALPREFAWRHGTQEWLTARLHSPHLVKRLALSRRTVGPLVACGAQHTLFLAEDQLWGCGDRAQGQLGELPYIVVDRVVAPVKLASPPSPVAIACGLGHSAVVTRDGQLWMCGANGFGQLGIPGVGTVQAWTRVVAFGDVRSMACGGDFTAVVAQGALWVTGSNSDGQLAIGPDGSGSFANTWLRTPFKMLTGSILQLACCQKALFVLSTEGLWAAGANDRGQLGLGDTVARNALTRVPLEGVHSIACGANFVYALTTRACYFWGDNHWFQISNDRVAFYATPTQKLNHTGTIVGVVCGYRHAILHGRETDGENYSLTMGAHDHGQSEVTDSELAFQRCYCGHDTTFLLLRSGLWASGSNTHGQLGIDKPPSAKVTTAGGEKVAIPLPGQSRTVDFK